jgi:hypothetical protein
MMDGMVNMMGGMGWGMGLVGILVLILLVLAIAALAKYLFGTGTILSSNWNVLSSPFGSW